MGCLGSIIILILGFSMGGPFGLLVASIVVVLMNSSMRIHTSMGRGVSEEELKNYLEDIIMLFSDITLVDGSVSRSEVEFVKEFLLTSFPGRTDIVQHLMERYRFYNDNPSAINAGRATETLRRRLNYNERVSLFTVLVSLSLRSSKSKKVKSRLREIGIMLGISEYEISSLLGYYQQYETRSTGGFVEDAYMVLGLKKEAGNDEVKKRYKDLVKETHPDKLRHMPENIRKKSEERFKAINEAYSRIKAERNF